MKPESVTTKPQKFRVNFRWAKIERGQCDVFAADEEQAQAIVQEMFRENYTPDCRIQEFTTVETVTK
jgi:hypothetical protein